MSAIDLLNIACLTTLVHCVDKWSSSRTNKLMQWQWIVVLMDLLLFNSLQLNTSSLVIT